MWNVWGEGGAARYDSMSTYDARVAWIDALERPDRANCSLPSLPASVMKSAGQRRFHTVGARERERTQVGETAQNLCHFGV